MTSGSAWIAAFSIGAFLAVSGCDENAGTAAKPAEGETSAAQQTRSVMQDVERPDIFSVSETALWDGRPSLGGVWVAHPDVKEPERALIRNSKTGQRIAGALFRRERDNPGPRIQLSSDAAAALGILAGQPTELSVVAVRQEEVVIEGTPAISEESAGEGANVAIENPPNAARVDDTGGSTAAAAGATVAASARTSKRPGFWGRFRNSLRNEPKRTATGATLDATTDPATVPEVETVTLDPVTTAAAAAIATAEKDDKPKARPGQTATAEPAPKPKPAANALKNPFIQVGLFSVEENADAASTSLRQAGIVPTIIPGENRWRVIVGPMTTADDQASLLGQIRSLGYQDAFLSPN